MAQQFNIRGSVADETTHESIPFANITLLNAQDSAMLCGCISDENGHFELSTASMGDYLLKISMVGYDRLYENICINSHADYQLGTLYLSAGKTLSEVSIVSLKPIFTEDGEKNIYNTANDPSIQSGTAIDALQNAPGLSVDSEGNIRLRGTQTVSIWINGRECRMNEESLKQYLKTLSAQNIKSVEVITNPSARYGGGSPVVNIVTNRHSQQNQFLSLGCNGNTNPTLLPWASYIFENKKWELSLYASGGANNDASIATNSQALLSHSLDTLQTESLITKKKTQERNAMLSMDVCYKIDSLNSLFGWFAFAPHWSSWETSAQNTRHQFVRQPGDYSYHETASKQLNHPSYDFLDGIWYEHLFDDTTARSFSIGYFGSGWISDSLVNLQRNHPYMPTQNISYRQSNSVRDWFHGIESALTHTWGTFDTTQRLFNNEIELGFEGSYSNKTVICTTDTLNQQQYVPCNFLSKEIGLRDLAGHIFGSYLHRWEMLTIKVSIRAKITKKSLQYFNVSQFDITKNSRHLIPSIHLTYLPGNHIFSLSYTYRTSTPDIEAFTEFRTYSLDGFSVGNPWLQIPKGQQFEGRWERFNEAQTASVGVTAHLNYNNGQQVNLANIAFDSAILYRYVVYQQPVNLGKSYNTGVSLNFGYRPNAFLNVRLNTEIYYDRLCYQSQTLDYKKGMLCYSARLNFWTKIWGKIQLFANASYDSPTQALFVTTLSRKTIDIGTNIDMLNHRLSINATINDVFDWNKWDKTTTNPLLYSQSQLKPLSRYISFSVTYRIGKMDLEQANAGSRHRR